MLGIGTRQHSLIKLPLNLLLVFIYVYYNYIINYLIN